MLRNWKRPSCTRYLKDFFPSLFHVNKAKVLKDETEPGLFDCLSDSLDIEDGHNDELYIFEVKMKINSLLQ